MYMYKVCSNFEHMIRIRTLKLYKNKNLWQYQYQLHGHKAWLVQFTCWKKSKSDFGICTQAFRLKHSDKIIVALLVVLYFVQHHIDEEFCFHRLSHPRAVDGS